MIAEHPRGDEKRVIEEKRKGHGCHVREERETRSAVKARRQ